MDLVIAHETSKTLLMHGAHHKQPTVPTEQRDGGKTVQRAKALMDKAHAQRATPYLSILEYSYTPVDGLKSPAQLLVDDQAFALSPSIH